MTYFFLALVCSVIGAVPLAVSRKIVPAFVLAGISFACWWFIFYLATPTTTVWPIFGLMGFAVLVNWIIGGIVGVFGWDEGHRLITVVPPALLFFVYIVTFVMGSEMLNAGGYYSLIGTVERRAWTQDIQPKDPAHMRLVTGENAKYLAQKVMGSAGSIGSQFQLAEDYTTLQTINGELWYVIPLDFTGYFVWSNTNGVPAYVMVHAEDPSREAILVKLPDEKRLRYTPGAYFDKNLERHLRTHGYLSTGIAEFQFEIDDAGKAWWVASLFKPKLMWDGEEVTGIAIINPVDGAIRYKSREEAPAWVDRVIPKAYVKNYIKFWGSYERGWSNTTWFGSKAGMVEPEDPGLIYGSEHQPDWVTGITSIGEKDDSLVGVMYTNSRTGKSVFYEIKGGGTDTAILEAVKVNQHVQYKKLHGADPQIYNVYGTMASVVPLLSENHVMQGVAIVNVTNIQTVAVGNNMTEALREYQGSLARIGQTTALDKTREVQTLTGVVDRVKPDVTSNGTVYYMHLQDVPHLFTGGSADFPKLPVTQPGDHVHLEYFASGEDVVPLHSFDNTSLPLTKTPVQTDVENRALARRDDEVDKRVADTVVENVKQLTPAQLRQLDKQIPKPAASP